MRGRGVGFDLRVNHLVAEFLILVEQALAGPISGRAAAAGRHCGGGPNGLARSWTTDELSALTDLGQSQIRRLFRKHLRTSLRQWLLRERLMQAQSLIVQNETSLARNCRDLRFLRCLSFQPGVQAIGRRPAGSLAPE